MEPDVHAPEAGVQVSDLVFKTFRLCEEEIGPKKKKNILYKRVCRLGTMVCIRGLRLMLGKGLQGCYAGVLWDLFLKGY